jgi:hypothetical protein
VNGGVDPAAAQGRVHHGVFNLGILPIRASAR